MVWSCENFSIYLTIKHVFSPHGDSLDPDGLKNRSKIKNRECNEQEDYFCYLA